MNNKLFHQHLLWFLVLGISLLIFASGLHGQTSTLKKIVFDWKTKSIVDNKPFPFDEPFEVEVTNLDSTIDTLQMIIKKGKRPHSRDPAVDTQYLKNLPAFQELSFTKNNLQSIVRSLNPNNYYYIGLQVKHSKPLDAQQKSDLKNYLATNIPLRTQLLQQTIKTNYSDINPSDYNRLLSSYIKSYRADYFFDTAGFQGFNIGQLRYSLAEAKILINDAGNKLKELNRTLKNKYARNQSNPGMIDSLIQTTPKGTKPLIESADFNQFLAKLDAVRPRIPISFTRADSIALTIQDAKSEVKNALDQYQVRINRWIDSALEKIVDEQTYIVWVLASTIESENTNASPYISQTFGYGYSSGTNNTLLYFAFSFFIRPVNQTVPFKQLSRKDRFKVQFCFNAGLTLEDITTNKHGKVSGLGSIFSNKAGIVGIGYRPLPFAKIDVNAMFYYLENPNPFIAHKKMVCSPLIGLSLNLNIIKLLAGQPNSLSQLKNP